MDQNYRRVYINLLTISTMPKAARDRAGCIDARQVVEDLAELKENQQALLVSEKTGRVTRLRDTDLNTQSLTLLISHSDPTSGDPVFENLHTGAQRVARKKVDEGMGSCVHVLIFSQALSSTTNSNTYVCVLEWGPNLGRSHIQRFINAQLHKITYSYDAGHGEYKECYYKVEIEPLASQPFLDALQEGRPLGFKVQDRLQKSPRFDESSRVELKQREISWRVGRGATVEGFLKNVRKQCRQKQEEGFTSVIIEYEEAATGSHRSQQFPISEDFINGACTKSVRLDLETPIDTSTEVIHRELRKKMLAVSKQEYNLQKGDGTDG